MRRACETEKKKPTVLQSSSICIEMTSIYYEFLKLNSKKPVNAKRALISTANGFRNPLLIPVIRGSQWG